MTALNAPASACFAAFCEELSPSVSWLQFHSVAELRHAMAAGARDRDALLKHPRCASTRHEPWNSPDFAES
jgi:hypothetical protein